MKKNHTNIINYPCYSIAFSCRGITKGLALAGEHDLTIIREFRAHRVHFAELRQKYARRAVAIDSRLLRNQTVHRILLR